MEKVSVITTFYNAQDFILTAIDSVLKQSSEGFQIEYVLVNDASTDNSLSIVTDYIYEHGTGDVVAQVISAESNLGCGGARKLGIENATGEYFMFLDADDYYINSDFVQRAYNDIKSTHADIIEYGLVYNSSDGSRTPSAAAKDYIILNKHDALLALYTDNLIKFNVWTKIYTRAIVESHPYSESRTFEDVRTIPHWVSNARRIIIRPTVEINYRAASESIIHSDEMQARIGTITGMAEMFEYCKDDPEVLKAMYSRAMIDLSAVLEEHSSENEGFNEMSRLNTYMLSYIYPDSYKEKTFNIDGYTVG